MTDDYMADLAVLHAMPDRATAAEIRAAITAARERRAVRPAAADQPFPPHWDRSIRVVYRPSLVPYFPYVLWCGECHRIVNTYETPIGAALFAHRHHDHGGHHDMSDQTITPHPVTEALVEWIAAQTGETNPVSVRLTSTGDSLVCTYRHGDPAIYAALIVDEDMRRLIDEHVNGATS